MSRSADCREERASWEAPSAPALMAKSTLLLLLGGSVARAESRCFPTVGSARLSSTKCGCRMATLERGFRRLTWVVSVMLASPFPMDRALSLFEKSEPSYFLLVATTTGFVLPWLVFFGASRWVASAFLQDWAGLRRAGWKRRSRRGLGRIDAAYR